MSDIASGNKPNKYMLSFFADYKFDNIIALFTYWVPFAICLVVYSCRDIKSYHRDIKASSDQYYIPTLRVGSIVLSVILTITPAVNLIAMVFDCMSSVFRWVWVTFDTPLVKKQKKME